MTDPAPPLPFADECAYLLARVLGTEPSSGFAIEREVQSRLVELTGRHRYSR